MSAKRLADIAVAALGLTVSTPLFVVIYLAIRLGGSREIIYRQERIGLGGRPFQILKFRTMMQGAEPDGVPQLAEAGDNRLTRVGRYLRSHHLDELPQLWNVLRGDMALVGYRPERKYFIDRIMALRPDYSELYAIRPGVTSMATLYNGYTNTMEKMIRRLDMDLDYLRNQSAWLDTKIITLTLLSIVTGKKF